ncbi:MAG TPA: acylphosphatase [Fibrobacteria bacterium]|nr:acylphosphatase [Fibrobacteria bacterium]
MLLHYDIRVSGKVQGVFFRASARAEADRLGLRGFVRNEEDGSVYAEAEGERENLDEFLQWCRKGPPHARVEGVKASTGEAKGFRGFHVR